MGDIDISNYFYFIFLLLSLIFGALGNKKKKNREKSGKKESPGFLEFVVNEFENTGREIRPDAKEQPVKVKEPESPLDKGVDIAQYARELRQKSKRNKRIKTSFDEQEFKRLEKAAYDIGGDSGSDQKIEVDFDLRTAVINDAILNRPNI